MSNGIKKTYKKSFYMFQKDKFYQLTKKTAKKGKERKKNNTIKRFLFLRFAASTQHAILLFLNYPFGVNLL